MKYDQDLQTDPNPNPADTRPCTSSAATAQVFRRERHSDPADPAAAAERGGRGRRRAGAGGGGRAAALGRRPVVHPGTAPHVCYCCRHAVRCQRRIRAFLALKPDDCHVMRPGSHHPAGTIGMLPMLAHHLVYAGSGSVCIPGNCHVAHPKTPICGPAVQKQPQSHHLLGLLSSAHCSAWRANPRCNNGSGVT